jgi:spermidine synthase
MFSFPWWLSLSVGFLSLSAEILWVRLVGFAYGGVPQAFSFVLANYLVGIAIGAVVGKWFCAQRFDLYGVAVPLLVISGVSDIFIPVIAPYIIQPINNRFLPLVALVIIVTAGLKSVLFPIAHHLGSFQSGSRIGRSVSKIYFGNIIGSTLGPLVTSYLLLDVVTTAQCFAIVGVLCVVVAAACIVKAESRKLGTAFVVMGLTIVTILWPFSGSDAMHKLAYKDEQDSKINHMIENKHGVIHVVSDSKRGDIVYGGNVYDGRAIVDIDSNGNRLDRLYMLALLHPRPKSVLVIGLSTGAWARAIQGFPDVERIDIVEINPGYLDLIRNYHQLAPLLRDPRVRIYIDDGRRWLKRNPEARYDLVVQNTSFHWRSNSTNLLSRQFFEEVKSHLNNGGIFGLNSTSSFDVFKTSQNVFDFTYRYMNFAYASNTPLNIATGEVKKRLGKVLLPGGEYFTAESDTEESVLNLLKNAKLEPAHELLQPAQGWAAIITDQNMLTEYRHGKRFGPHKISQYFLPPRVPQFDYKTGHPFRPND